MEFYGYNRRGIVISMDFLSQYVYGWSLTVRYTRSILEQIKGFHLGIDIINILLLVEKERGSETH